ncbi:MAG: LysR family transcriptional regulator [Lachnospiraceae bacterium]
MELKQLEYIVAIADHGNISKAAKALFITQSGLNQHLIKLEQELGVVLFYRDKHNLQITPAGKIYIANAREILQIKKNTYSLLDDLKGNIIGEITLGLTHEHGIDLFTAVFPEFNEKYPGVTFNLLERVVAEQQHLISIGHLDLGIVLGNFDNKDLRYIELYHEDLILGISRNHPLAKYAAPAGEPFATTDLSLFRDETFSLIFATSTMREIIDPLFEQAGFKPKILIETSMNHALVKLVNIGYGCTILPHSRAISSPYFSENVWFYLSSYPNWSVCLTHRNNTQFNGATRYFISLLQKYGDELNELFFQSTMKNRVHDRFR